MCCGARIVSLSLRHKETLEREREREREQMQKTELPPVDMQHVCKYTEEIIEKLKKKKWIWHKKLEIWTQPAQVSGFLHQQKSFSRITEQSNDKSFFTLPEFSYKKWKELQAIYYASKNNKVYYGICPDRLIELLQALGKRYNKTTISNIVLGFPQREDVILVFIPYKDDYARFVIAPMLLVHPAYHDPTYPEANIYGTSYIEPKYLFYDIEKGIVGPLYKGKIITMDDYKQKWVVHILSNS